MAPCYLNSWGCSVTSWTATPRAVTSPTRSIWDAHEFFPPGRSRSSRNFCQQSSDQRKPCKLFKTMTRVSAARKPGAVLRVSFMQIKDEAGSVTIKSAVSLSLLGSLSFSVPIAQAASNILDPGNAALASNILGPLLAAFNLLFVIRIVMSWYPQLPVNKLPYVIAYAPTEPVLAPTRKRIPPVGGVDISPVIWVALVSFSNEILLGQQGLLVLLSQQQP